MNVERRRIYQNGASTHFLAANISSADENRTKQKQAIKVTLMSFFVFAAYATLRYNVFGLTPWSDWPVFVLNKIIALTSVALLIVAVYSFTFQKGSFNGKLLYNSGILALIHSAISLLILSEDYYPKFYERSKLTVYPALSIILGLLVMIYFYVGKRTKGKTTVQRIYSIGLIAFFSGLHAALLGFKGWFTPSLWPSGMPPLTLISFIMGDVAFAAVLVSVFKKFELSVIKN